MRYSELEDWKARYAAVVDQRNKALDDSATKSAALYMLKRDLDETRRRLAEVEEALEDYQNDRDIPGEGA